MNPEGTKKQDRRVMYTKMFLHESLLDLMREKPVDKITPTELCRRANINRNTFYTHYYSVKDVLEEIEADFADQIIDSLSGKFAPDQTMELLVGVCRIIYERMDFCEVLLSENGDAKFLENVINMGKSVVLSGWREQGFRLSDAQMELFFAFIVNGSIAVIRKWAASDTKALPEDIAKLIEIAAYGGINEQLEKKETDT